MLLTLRRNVETAAPAASACAANDAGDVTKVPEKKITLPEKDMPAAARVGSR
jgi:hypothetical protein